MKIIDDDTMRSLISQNFTSDELNELCNSLGVSIADISGKGVLNKAYQMVSFMEGHSRTRDLFDALHKLKPEIFSEYYFDAATFNLPLGSDLQSSSIYTDPTLIEVPLEQTGSRIVQLEVDDPSAKLLIEKIENLLDRLIGLDDGDFRLNAYETLEEASRLLRGNPKKVDDWQLQMLRAEFLIRRTARDIYRAEILRERKKAKVNSIIEAENKRAQDERKITWLVPVVILGYSGLVVLLTLCALLFGGENYIVPVLGLPLSILLWSSIGSLSALLYRYYKRKKTSGLISEVRLMIGRFWLGVVAGSIFYFAIRSGLFVLSNEVVDLSKEPAGLQQILFILVWLIAFSDFLFERVIARISGNVIGEEQADEVVASILKETTSEIADTIARATNEQLAVWRRLKAEVDETRSNSPEVTKATGRVVEENVSLLIDESTLVENEHSKSSEKSS